MSDPKRVVKLAKMFQDVLDVAMEMNEISDLEQARRNAEDNLNSAIRDHTVASRSLSDVKVLLTEAEGDLKLVKKGAEDMISLANANANRIVEEAKGEADRVIKAVLLEERVVADCIVIDQERHAAEMEIHSKAEAAARIAVEGIEEKLADLRAQIGL